MRATQAGYIAALALACGTSTARTAEQPEARSAEQPTMPTKAARPAPWTLVYADGSANVYRFSQPSAEALVDFEYVPVTREQSNTGTYSGGEPRRAQLAADDARLDEVWRRVEALEADTALHNPDRNKGTGAFTIKTPAGTRDFIIDMGPPLDELHGLMKQFRD